MNTLFFWLILYKLQTMRQSERNQLSLSEFKVILMVLVLVLMAEMLLPPVMSSCFLQVLLCHGKGSPMVEFLTENLFVSKAASAVFLRAVSQPFFL